MAEFNYMIVTPSTNIAYRPTVANHVKAALEGIVTSEQIVPTNLNNVEKATGIARKEPIYKLAVVVTQSASEITGLLDTDIPVVILTPKGLTWERLEAITDAARGRTYKRVCGINGNPSEVIRNLVQSAYSAEQFTPPEAPAPVSKYARHNRN